MRKQALVNQAGFGPS